MELFHQILVIVVLLFTVISLYREWFGVAFTFAVGVIVFGVSGLLTPKEMISGFANEQIIVIILLLLLGDSIRKTGLFENVFNHIFSKAKSTNGFLLRMMLLVSGFSAFLNNTPLVAILMPYIHTWSKKKKISASKLLIPLSYAAILGGCVTLVGTSTNLIVNSFVVDQTIVPNMQSLNMFDFSLVGLPMVFIGILYILIIGKRLLPNRSDIISNFSNMHRQYLVEAEVKSGSELNGKSVAEAGLRNLQGLFLAEIYRGEREIFPVSSSTILYENDILIFAGDTETIADMVTEENGLRLTQLGMFSKKSETEIREIVVSHNSGLIGKTIKNIKFRGKYDAAVIAVHRNGQRISGKIGMIKLAAGDVLLLITGANFPELARETMDFYPITKIRGVRKIPLWKSALLIGGLFSAIVLSALNLVSLFISLSVLLLLIIGLGIVKVRDIPKSLDYNLAAIIAFSLAFGIAMMKSGVAAIVADFVVDISKPFGTIGLMFGLFAITNLLSAYITNKASIAIIFPIALTLAVNLNVEPLAFILLVTFAAAASFITPIGYQTNLMVYGPGSYKFSDYMKVGLPLTILYMFVTVFILAISYKII